MEKLRKIFRENDKGSMGVGAMIIFIAMVLVAGIAASVFVQVANELQMQALFSGRETLDEVSTGVKVMDIEGHVTNISQGIDLMTISIKGRAGSGDIDISELAIELADDTTKVVLKYDSSQYNNSVGDGGVFNVSAFDLDANEFGIIVIEDADGSCQQACPIINKGDLIMLTINTSATFSPAIPVRTNIWGNVIPEFGSWGIVNFRTPATYTVDISIYDLQ
jgi:flagellin FlaB